MKFEIIAVTTRSITIELDNTNAFVTVNHYNVLVNGQMALEGMKKNVCSVFGLEADTLYQIDVVDQVTGLKRNQSVKTDCESVCLNVKRFGAVGDGEHPDTMAIQAAIMACPDRGTVLLPKGTYYCTPLFLKSNMILELAEGAVIKGHTDRNLYPILPGYTVTTDEQDEYYLGTWEGNPLNTYASLITGIGVENVAIIGKGVIDGNAEASDWWVEPKKKRGAWRPRTLFLNGCTNIIVQGITVRNSPSWTVHPYMSNKLSFLDMKIENNKDSPNTDGLDPESCSDVRIVGIDFSVGDDCIAIKSGKLYMGKRLKQPSEKLIIRNCRMRHGHGAVVIGSEMSGGVRDIKVTRCLFEKTDRGLRIKTRRGRGEEAVIDNIFFNQIKMVEVLTPFVINMFYFCDPDGETEYVWSKEPLPVDERTPKLGHFSFSNIDCIDCEVSAGYFYGLPERPIEEIHLKDINISFKEDALCGTPAMMSFAEEVCKQGIYAENVRKLEMNNVCMVGNEGARLTHKRIDQITDIRKA